MDELSKIFGTILCQARKKAGLSQEKLALKSSLDRTYISLLERGKRQPSLKSIIDIARALDISPTELISAVEDKIGDNKEN